jgi:hypothetical protein
MQDRPVLALQYRDALGQRRAVHQVRCADGVTAVVHLPAHDLAAVEVEIRHGGNHWHA